MKKSNLLIGFVLFLTNSYRCSFCGRDKSEALILIAGIDGHICEVFVEQAQEIIQEELFAKEFINCVEDGLLSFQFR